MIFFFFFSLINPIKRFLKKVWTVVTVSKHECNLPNLQNADSVAEELQYGHDGLVPPAQCRQLQAMKEGKTQILRFAVHIQSIPQFQREYGHSQKSTVGGWARAGTLVSQVICGHSAMSEKTGFTIVKKKKKILNILKTIPLCNSTSVETLNGQIVSKEKMMNLKYSEGNAMVKAPASSPSSCRKHAPTAWWSIDFAGETF